MKRYDGQRIYIRFLSVADARDMLNLQTRNREIFEKITASERTEAYYTMEGQISLLEKWTQAREDGTRYSFGIFLRSTDELIGEVSMFEIELNMAKKWIVGYVLDQHHNGQGYMSEALQQLFDFSLNEVGVQRLEAGALPDNIGSIRVLEKAGFRQTGVQSIVVHGMLKEHVMYAITLKPSVD
ncbi:GNAT family N-acetyltransferase [Paenibacillus xylanexedens]|uniref:GNAT family N-acetyltransferase n=1 Tax=Paenibacillus xylanexedens TaxID=528191 RepID=UPI0011A61C5C|nr:GNAT family protein [Paenibacillus xylanexedens]